MPQEIEIQKAPVQASVSFSQMFEQALAQQQKKNWDASLEAYQKLLDQGTTKANSELSDFQASAVYHNMSTIAFEKGDFLKAYIWSKKSLYLNPSNQLAQESFTQFSKKFEIPVIAHQISNYDYFKSAISKASLDVWVIFSFILVFATLWLTIKNVLITKKNQLANNFSTPAKWPVFSVALITLLILSMTYIRYQDFSITRALVIAEKAQIQTAPGENKPVIFEAQAGLELEVLNFDQGYFQVRYSGAFSGWVKKNQLEILSLSFEQKN